MVKMLKTSAVNRKCIYPNCKQVLSIYNHEPYCYIHREIMLREQKQKIIPHPKG